MKLTLAIKKLSPFIDNNGITKIGMSDLIVINKDTGEELEEITGMLWGSRDLIIDGDNPLLTPKHIQNDPDDSNYMVLIIKCNEAINI